MDENISRDKVIVRTSMIGILAYVFLAGFKAFDELDRLNRNITIEVYKKHNVILTAIGVYSFNTKDDNAATASQPMISALSQSIFQAALSIQVLQAEV